MTNRSIFYGWWVVAAFSVTTFMSTGVRHAVGPFLKPIVADLGLDRASFSAVIALSLFLYGVFMPIAGMALDRFSVRAVTTFGTVGLLPDGGTARPGTVAAPVERVTASEALQTLAFWQLAGSFFTCGFSMSLLSAHGIPMLTDHGYTPMFASWTMGVLGGSAIGFTVMLGALSDRFGRRPVLAAIYAGRVAIFSGLFLIRDNPTAILVVAVAGGVTLAGTGSMTSALTADIYGRFSVSSVFGLIFLVHQTGSAIGSALAGLLFETTGGYGAAFALACVFLVSAAIVALNIDKGARRIWRAATASATN